MPTKAEAGTYSRFTEAGQQSSTDAHGLSELQFKLDSSEYFAFLASLLGVVEECVSGTLNGVFDTNHALLHLQTEMAFIQSTRQDLLHLHEHYEIAPRTTAT